MDEMREALEKAFDEDEQPAEEQAEMEFDDVIEGEAEEVEDAPEEVDEAKADEPADEESDEGGDEEPEVETAATAEVEEEAPPVDTKPPVGWKPAARETWSKIPAAARDEILRREREVDARLQETAEERKAAEAFKQAVTPFQQTINLEAGGDPVAATKNLMGIATKLRFGNEQEKAVVVRDIINAYQVDIATLDSALTGEMPVPTWQEQMAQQPGPMPTNPALYAPQAPQPGYAPPPQPMQDPQAEFAAFAADPANEWFSDVREDMLTLMNMAGQRGQQLTLKDAYDRAVALNPEIQGVLQSRVQTEQSQESLKRKKRAAQQISGKPAASPESAPGPGDMRGQIAAAWDDALQA